MRADSGNGVAGQAVRVAGAVEAFVMVAGDVDGHLQEAPCVKPCC